MTGHFQSLEHQAHRAWCPANSKCERWVLSSLLPFPRQEVRRCAQGRSGRVAGHWTQAWLTEAPPLTRPPPTSWRGNQIRVRPVMLSVLSVTHLRSRCPLHSSAFAAGCALVAAWDLQVVCGPAKLLPVQGVGVQPYPRSPGSQRNQQSGRSQSSCFLPSPGNAWLGLALLLGRVSGPFVLGLH